MTTSPVGRPRPGLSAAAWVLVLSSWAGALLCLGAGLTGCWAIASDLSTQGEDWDGLGLFIGGMLLLVSIPLGVLCAALARGATRGLRVLRMDGRASALTPSSLTATVAGWVVAVCVTGDLEADPIFLVGQFVAWAVALSGTMTLILSLVARSWDRAPVKWTSF